MKVTFTLVFIFITIIINGQIDSFRIRSTPVFAANSNQSKAQNAEIRLACKAGSNNTGTEPLIVIDGIPCELGELKKLKPDDIESITILKEAAAAAIYGCRAVTGVIIITTKSSSVRKFIIKDFLTGEKIPSATICFTSDSDTIEEVADDNGILSTDKLKKGVKYHVTTSSAGYKTLRTIAAGKEQEVLLEKDIKTCAEVVVIAYPTIRCGCCHGSQVLLQSEKIIKGFNRFSIKSDARWAAGIYIIQLKDKKGNVLRCEKLVVQ
ncbi:MAG TPA: TonB-dependent receptor plug domain-containing protein [Chitinophagaceae bacterium]|nr:TonB-dependent receptor plug domain-containing protein [Chitinophagaceae bacterium]